MNRYLYGIIAVAALAIAGAVLGISFAMANEGADAQRSNSDNPCSVPSKASLVNILTPEAPNPFDQTTYCGILNDLLPDDLGVLVYINAGTADVTLELISGDLGTHGDTLWLNVLARTSPDGPFIPIDTVWCTSPADPCLISAPFPVGAIVLTLVGYIDVPGIFPAGYYLTATAS